MTDKLKKEVLNSDNKITLPSHHETELEIRVGERLTDNQKIERIKSIGKSVIEQNIKIGVFLCLECDLVYEFEDDGDYAPIHHGEEMVRIQVG